MGRKKKRSAPNLRDRIFCYYCERNFHQEQELLSHQRDKHLRCPVCNKRLISVQSMIVHAEQMHNTQIQSVPNALPGRDSVAVDVLGMKGIPDSYYDGTDPERAKRQRQIPAPMEPPIHNIPTNVSPTPLPTGQPFYPPLLPALYVTEPAGHTSRYQEIRYPSLHTSGYGLSYSQSHAASSHPMPVSQPIPHANPSYHPAYPARTTPGHGPSPAAPQPTNIPAQSTIANPSNRTSALPTTYPSVPAYTPSYYPAVSGPRIPPYEYTGPVTLPPITYTGATPVHPNHNAGYPQALHARSNALQEPKPHIQTVAAEVPGVPIATPVDERVLYEAELCSQEEMRAEMPRYRAQLRFNSATH